LLLERIDTNRVGIITFAGIAFYHCPLTIDLSAAKDLLSIIDTEIVPYPGTKIGLALQEAIRVLQHTGRTAKIVVLFTDGEDHDSSPLDFAEEAKKLGIVVYTVGVGTPEGKPIPLRDNTGKIVDYKKDKEGNIVTSKLNEQLLYDIAEITNGRYFHSSYGEFGIAEGIVSELSSMRKTELKSKIYHLYKNRYHYFVYIIILLILIDIFLPKKWYVKL
ncbi:MAG: VWA domain-containing protein, partial [Endomicrobia bacterium]|nr:VWA domain-containing protein [Endomicrobiia bacterium]